MFIDEVDIYLRSGKGGNGETSFRREKSVQFGGPNGGDGGRGGDIVFFADPNINTLIDFKFKKEFCAEDGAPGGQKCMHGRDGKDLIIRVPVGTMVRDIESGKLVLDMNKPNESKIFLKGGRSGRGNVHFKTATRRAPRISEKGGKARELNAKLELKLLADVALVGYPNVGKSSMINKISAAKSKVANYQFTTLHPKLGVVRIEEMKSFVVADIPGLIEGAHEGKGLGDKFLRHIERCKLIYHVIDASCAERDDLIQDFEKINHELKNYSEKLFAKKQIVIANKMDMVFDDTKFKEFKAYLAEKNIELYEVSALLGEGLKSVLYKTYEMLTHIAREQIEEEVQVEEVLSVKKLHNKEWIITRNLEDGVYEVEGRVVDLIKNKFNIDDEDSMFIFLNMLKEKGFENELRKAGVKDGDVVRIDDLEFDFID